MTTSDNNNHFGRYLSELRHSRGYTNTNEYLRKYPLAMSSVHYRHLESGNRKISIDSARELCQALQADAKVFYCNLLRDCLPEEFMDFFATLSRDKNLPSTVEDRDTLRQKYQNAVMRALDSQVLFPSMEACDYLEKHFELMPIIWFIYSVPKVNLFDIDKIIQKNKLAISANDAVDALLRLSLVKKEIGDAVVRVKPSICFSHHELGLRILKHETERSLKAYVQPRNPQLNESVLILSVMSASEESRKIIFKRIQDFVRKLRESAVVSFHANESESEPVFYSIVFAPRGEYSAKSIEDSF